MDPSTKTQEQTEPSCQNKTNNITTKEPGPKKKTTKHQHHKQIKIRKTKESVHPISESQLQELKQANTIPRQSNTKHRNQPSTKTPHTHTHKRTPACARAQMHISKCEPGFWARCNGPAGSGCTSWSSKADRLGCKNWTSFGRKQRTNFNEGGWKPVPRSVLVRSLGVKGHI